MDYESRCHIDGILGSMISVFGFGRRDVANGFEQATMVEPVDPFKRDISNCFEAAPRSLPMDYLRLVEVIDRLDEGVVVAIADATD